MTCRARTPHLAVGLAAGFAVLTSCAASDAPASTPTTAAPTATSAVGFVPPPACVAVALDVWTAAVRIDQRRGTADALVRVAVRDGSACEIVLAPDARVASFVEPNVVIEDGGWAELVMGEREDSCAEAVPITSAEVRLHDDELLVPTAAVACDLHLTELLAVERPVEPCTAADVTAVWAPAGFVVRNDGMRGCVLGTLEAVALADGTSLAATATRTPSDHVVPERVGPVVNALAPGDVVLFPTFPDPVADCQPAVVEAVLVLTAATIDVRAPVSSSCVYVDLGAARPWYGAAGGPLTDVDADAPPATWLRDLDEFGDPCRTVAVAPADLVDGAPILSPAVIEEDELGRTATWGDPASNGVTQRLDVVVEAPSGESDDRVVDVVDGLERRATVVASAGDGGPTVDVAEDDGSCTRRYLLPPGTSTDAAVDAARRWVR